jgi:hypothetical protein
VGQAGGRRFLQKWLIVFVKNDTNHEFVPLHVEIKFSMRSYLKNVCTWLLCSLDMLNQFNIYRKPKGFFAKRQAH